MLRDFTARSARNFATNAFRPDEHRREQTLASIVGLNHVMDAASQAMIREATRAVGRSGIVNAAKSLGSPINNDRLLGEHTGRSHLVNAGRRTG
jgi:hypothetical protein